MQRMYGENCCRARCAQEITAVSCGSISLGSHGSRDEEGDLCEVSDSDQDDIGAMQIPQTGILGVLAVHTISGAVLGSTHSITG